MWIRSHVQFLQRKTNSLYEEQMVNEKRICKAKMESKSEKKRKEIPEDLNFVHFWSLRHIDKMLV